MKMDTRLVTGILLGVVLGLHYHTTLVLYLPLLTVAALIVVLNTIRH